MPSYQFSGNHQSVTIEGITFIKDTPTELTADQLKTLKASGFWQAYLNNGGITEVAAEQPKATAKATAKTPTKAAAEKPIVNDDKAQ